MVMALHRAGIGNLDVVFNHTAEGTRTARFCFSLENRVYYVENGGRYYRNYTGCGNTLNATIRSSAS